MDLSSRPGIRKVTPDECGGLPLMPHHLFVVESRKGAYLSRERQSVTGVGLPLRLTRVEEAPSIWDPTSYIQDRSCSLGIREVTQVNRLV